MTASHRRRKGYWRYYERADAGDMGHLAGTLARLVRENPHPGRVQPGRGRPPVHSRAKLDFACLYMMACDHTFREASRRLDGMRDMWDEPAPDHSWLARHMQTIDAGWMDRILAETAEMCLAELGGATAPLGTDSSGAETDRYRTVEKPCPELEGFVQARVKVYIKYHVTAVLGHQIILSALTTPGSANDTSALPAMLGRIRLAGFDLSGRRFNADRAYDSDLNCAMAFDMEMIPNIKQRGSVHGNRRSRGRPSRRRAAGLYDPEEYKLRGMIEGIFGAEEARGHRLHCRFVREDNRRRFGMGRAIAWNVRVLGRLRCANELGIPIPSYGTAPAA